MEIIFLSLSLRTWEKTRNSANEETRNNIFLSFSFFLFLLFLLVVRQFSFSLNITQLLPIKLFSRPNWRWNLLQSHAESIYRSMWKIKVSPCPLLLESFFCTKSTQKPSNDHKNCWLIETFSFLLRLWIEFRVWNERKVERNVYKLHSKCVWPPFQFIQLVW